MHGDATTVAAAPSHIASSTTWMTYQMRADHNAVIRSDTLVGSWAFDTHARMNGGMAIDGDVLYVGAFDHSVMSLRLDDGSLLWRTTLPNVIMSTPIVAHGLVFVGTGTNHHLAPMKWGRPEGDAVIALDTSNGRIRWTFKTTGEDMPSPVFVRDRLVFANGDGYAYALDARSGKLLWRKTLNGISTMASATSDGRTVFLSTCTMQLSPGLTYAVDAMSGAERWRAPYGNCDSSPVLAGDRVFLSGIRLVRTSYGVGYMANVAALDVTTGRARWVYETPGPGISSTFVSSERAVAGTFSNGTYYQSVPTHDRLFAFDPVSGRIRWSLQTLGPVKMSPVVRGGVLFAGDTTGCLYSVDARGGTLRAVRTFDAPFSTSPPLLVNDTLIVTVGQVIRALPLRGGIIPPGGS